MAFASKLFQRCCFVEFEYNSNNKQLCQFRKTQSLHEKELPVFLVEGDSGYFLPSLKQDDAYEIVKTNIILPPLQVIDT